MFLFYPHIAGIELTESSFKLAVIKKKKKGWEACQFDEIPYSSHVNPIDKLPKGAIVVTALSTRETLVRPLKLPLKKESAIESAYPFQLEPLLPFTLEKGVFQKIILDIQNEETLLTAMAIRKDHLERHLQIFHEKEIEPEFITSVPHALATLSGQFFHNSTSSLIMHLGEKEGTCILAEKGRLIASRAFEIEKFEIQKTVSSLLATSNSSHINTILLFTKDASFANMVSEVTGKAVVVPNLSTSLTTEEKLHQFAIPLGIALTATSKAPISFRQKEFTYPYPWKRIKKPFFLSFTCFLVLFGVLFSAAKINLHNREKNLLERARPLLLLDGKKEKEADSAEALFTKLEKISRKINSQPNLFPLYPLVPKVSDVLTWISTNETITSGIKIEDFHYVLVDRPDFTKKSSPYLVKVELTFTSLGPSFTEAFREMLTGQNPYVNLQKEFKMESKEGKTQVSFFLKDKTRYSPT